MYERNVDKYETGRKHLNFRPVSVNTVLRKYNEMDQCKQKITEQIYESALFISQRQNGRAAVSRKRQFPT